jgi:hypothetical protein
MLEKIFSDNSLYFDLGRYSLEHLEMPLRQQNGALARWLATGDVVYLALFRLPKQIVLLVLSFFYFPSCKYYILINKYTVG